MTDLVNHPPHYTNGKVECIDAIESALTREEYRGFLKGQVLKYTWRERHKGGVEDLKKSEFYSKRLIALDEGDCRKLTIAVGDKSWNVASFSVRFEEVPSTQPIPPVGDGYRLATNDDIGNPQIEVWHGMANKWSPRPSPFTGKSLSDADVYRVPVEPVNDDPDGVGDVAG